MRSIRSSSLLYVTGSIICSLALVVSSEFATIEKNDNLTEHLARRLREVKVEIAKEHLKASNDETGVVTVYDVKCEKLWSSQLNSSAHVLTVKMFDRMFILEDNRGILIDIENNTSFPVSFERSVRLVKVIEWMSRLFLLLCDEAECDLYNGKKNVHPEFVQKLEARGIIDATFFTQANRLYLIIVYDKTDEFPVSSIIYRWTDTYMDISVERFTTVGAVSVTAFDYRNSAIIVFRHSNKKSHRLLYDVVQSEIYQFNDNQFERMQYLSTNGSIYVKHYRHNGIDFLLIVKDRQTSSVYWWDGNEFLHWLDLNDLVAPSTINIIQFNGDTLFFVAYEHSIRLYNVMTLNYTRLNSFELEFNDEIFIDMGVWIDDKTKMLNLLSVTLDPTTNIYRIERWELRFEKNVTNKPVKIQESVDATEQCLSKLHERLDDRMIQMENLTRYIWPLLLGSDDDTRNTVENLVFPELIIGSAFGDSLKIGKIEIYSSLNDAEILLPIDTSVTTKDTLISSFLNDSRMMLKKHGNNRLTGNVIVEGDTNFHEVHTNSIRTSDFNGQLIPLESFFVKTISATGNQMFANSQLRGNNITIRYLKIDKLCGIPHEYWLRNGNEGINDIFIGNNTINIFTENDTVLVRNSALTTTVRNLELRTIENVHINDLFSNIFILGGEQLIKGNIIHRTTNETMIFVRNIVTKVLNGISAIDLLTIAEQNITQNVMFAGKMQVENLQATRINGIAVTDCAMVSKKNNITGDLTIPTLIITKQLSIDDSTKFPIVHPVQVYDNVTIFGNVRARNVLFEPKTNCSLASAISTGSDEYWTKSTSQTLKNRVFFKSGLTIDELQLDYLNELDPNVDIMLTSLREISAKSSSIELTNFTANELFMESEDTIASLPRRMYEDLPDSLLFNEEIRIERLAVQQLYITKFNGIPLNDIMEKYTDNTTDSPYEYTEIDSIQKFETVTVNNRMEMENLHFQFIGYGKQDEGTTRETELQRFDNGFLRFDENYKIPRIKTEQLFLGDVEIQRSNTTVDIETLRDYFYSKLIVENSSQLIIDGDAMIEVNLEVETINHKSSLTYLDELATERLSVNSDDNLVIDNLIVRGNLTMNRLRGSRLESIVESTLSKSRAQNLSGWKFSFVDIFVDELSIDRINDRDIRNLIYVDSYAINFGGDVTFANLSINSGSESMSDIRTKHFNGYPVLNDELYEKLGNISSRTVDNLMIQGNVSWQQTNYSSSTNETQFEIITRHAMRRNNISPIVIDTNSAESTIIESSTGVFVSSMKSTEQKMSTNTRLVNGIDIEKFLNDSVLDDPTRPRRSSTIPSETDEIRIEGEKNFAKALSCVRLSVYEEIDIRELDNWRIDDLNSSIVRINSTKNNNILFAMSNTTVKFRGDIEARKLVIGKIGENSNVRSAALIIHGLPFDGIVTETVTEDYKKYLPDGTVIEHLVVLNDAFVKSLDSVDLDEFANDRVSLYATDSSIVIRGNVQFNGQIRVSENASVVTINDIVPSDLVINDSAVDQIIFGNETLISGDLIVNGKTYAPLVAGINLTDEYNNAVLNHERVEIRGDIIFQDDVEKSFAGVNFEKAAGGGFVNGIPLRSFIENRENADVNLLRHIEKIENYLESRITEVANVSLPKIFYYLEPEANLVISDVPNVERVKVMRLEETTLLGMYTSQLGNYCGLPKECPCRVQYITEIASNGDHCRSRKVQEPWIFYYFHAPNAFTVSVATTTVSRSERCSLPKANHRNEGSDDSKRHLSEYTTISWTKHEQQYPSSMGSSSLGSNATKNAPKIYGYLSDAAIFTQNDLIYIVLAIYYDPSCSSHRTNSLIYVLDLATNVLTLAQNIPTSHAIAVEVFKVPKKGPHVFFSSFDPGNSTVSVLYRLEANTTEFRLLESFPNGGNRRAKSVSQPNEDFLFLDDIATNSINVYRYDVELEIFTFHQGIYHDSMAPVAGIETLYVDEFRESPVYVIVTTERDQFFIYEYTFMRNFQLIASKKINGILSMVPFVVADRRYMLVGTDRNSTVLRIVEQGSPGG